MEQVFSVEARQYRFLVDRIKLASFRGFQNEVEIHFEPDLTVFIAQNGGGKTTVLDALYEHLQLLEKNTFQPGKYTSILTGKDVNVNTDTFSELNADFILDFMDYELLEEPVSIEENDEDQGGALLEYRGIPIHTSFYLNKVAGIDGISIIDSEQSLSQIRAFNNLKRELCNFPVFKYYQPGERSGKNAKQDFKSITDWIERCQKMAYQAKEDSKFESRLKWLNEAISTILKDEEYEYSDFKVKYTERGDILELTKQQRFSPDKYTFSIDQLSSGERALIGIVADLAIELIEKNPNFSKNPIKEGFGVVLIDEVDVHLHPEWQLTVAQKLCAIFPNVQFVVTSHSPLVLSSLTTRQVRQITDYQIFGVDNVYGRDASYIIKVIMEVANGSLADEVKKIGDEIVQDRLSEAEQKLKALITDINSKGEDGENHPDVLRLSNLMTRKKILSR
ncbi:AAA family ATPase [Haliscomenobacter hydrossis]|uniref:Uncharacterized protein n=1 Tax=Haliscomenobacter hydrossis (strain ATCC 27775 / DSM 1100 / LMG 10767 / O) TaxID=760192 RepID=F4L2J6_HALH1|nr:AAA family ATPase [Haliscomenobacter hydrossis]AEE53914.1 hypothetical protein Halhy_6092 [Haliscomenobacter hydrossis DSM 1100]